jgi:hypothetical protein
MIRSSGIPGDSNGHQRSSFGRFLVYLLGLGDTGRSATPRSLWVGVEAPAHLVTMRYHRFCHTSNSLTDSRSIPQKYLTSCLCWGPLHTSPLLLAHKQNKVYEKDPAEVTQHGCFGKLFVVMQAGALS